jgi:hypothetical protein
MGYHDVASLNFTSLDYASLDDASLDDASLGRGVPRTLHPQDIASLGCCIPRMKRPFRDGLSVPLCFHRFFCSFPNFQGHFVQFSEVTFGALFVIKLIEISFHSRRRKEPNNYDGAGAAGAVRT